MYSMKQACAELGMSYEALKFYCNQGLVPNVKRDKNNYRVFDERDIKWIKGLVCLKKCGMSIKDMKTFMELCMLGEESIPQRKVILAEQREEIEKQMEELKANLRYIDNKQKFYDDVLAGKTKYVSNLLPIEK